MIYKFHHKELFKVRTSLQDREIFETPFLLFKDGEIEIKASPDKPFSWDGCSPKIKISILGKTFFLGTWDGRRLSKENNYPETYFASMIHDAIYFEKEFIDISRKEADILFLKMLLEVKFPLAFTYYFAVRIFGGLFGNWKRL